LTHCNTLQHNATHCNTSQHTATHRNTLQHTATQACASSNIAIDHPYRPFWLNDTPKQATLKNKVLLEDYLKRNPDK